jgi:hypothetical protein
MSDDNPRDANHKGDSRQKKSDPANNAEPLIVTIEPQTKNAHSYEAKDYRLERARFRLDKKAYRTTHWTMVFLIIYTGFTLVVAISSIIATWFAYKQSTLMHQQLVGTMSAIVVLQEPRVTNDQATNKELLVMQLVNRGHVISPEAHITFEIAIASFPQMEAIHQAQSYAISVPQFGETGWNKNYPLPDLSAQDTHFPSQRKTVTVKGKFGFDNGFGDKITDREFCYSYIGSYNIKNEDGGSTSGGGGFIPCDEFGGKVSYISAHQLK